MVDAASSGEVASDGSSLTGLPTWCTEDVLNAFLVAAGDTRWHGDRVAQARVGLQAIAPMVEKLLEMQSNGGYAAGHEAALQAVEKGLEPHFETWWVEAIIDRVREGE